MEHLQIFSSPRWVPGWFPWLRKRISSAVSDPHTTNRVTNGILDAAYKQVDAHLRTDPAGPSAFDLLMDKLSHAWQLKDLGSGVDRLRSYGVANGVTYADYIQQFRQLVTIVLAAHGVYKPSVSQVQSAVRDSLLRQYPNVATTLLDEKMATVEAPWGVEENCLDSMWAAVDQSRFTNNPAINGESFYTAVSSTKAHRGSAYSSSASVSKRQPPSAPANSAWAAGPSPSVMNIDPQPANDTDPFELKYPHWPLDGHHSLVYQISEGFNTSDPSLFTPLVTQQDRYKALQDYRGQCLNCLGTNHSFKECAQQFRNRTGLLNPAIGTNETLWRRWQKRMQSSRLTRNTGNGRKGHNGWQRK